eukprot:XP_001689711.1 predicted protein [Chlamydomonas reinhardtii]
MAALGPTPSQRSASPQLTEPRRGAGTGQGYGLDGLNSEGGTGAAAFATGRGGLGAASSSMETLPSTGSGAVLPPRPRVAAAHTAASRNHQRAPRRAISTVGLMAEELRASGATPLERAANAAAASATAGHGHGDHQNHSQAPHTAQPGASHSRFANLSRPASRTAAAATATTVLGSNSSLSPPDSPRGQFAPLTQGSFGAGDGAYGTVPTSSPIPSVPYYTAAAPPPPSYNAVLLPILATPSELNAFVETAVGSGRADGALGISMSLGGGSSSRSGSPAPGRHAAYVHPHTHGQGQGQGQMGRLSFGDGYSHDGAGAGGGAGAHMGHMSEVLEAVLQQRRPPSSLDRAAGAAAAAAEGSDLSSPAAHMPLSLRRDLSGEDDPGLVLPYDDSGTSNVYGSLGRGRAPYTDCSASPSPAGTARSDGAGAGGAVAGIWPLASGSMVVSSGTAAVNSSFGGAAAVARDAATLLSERKAAVRAACSSSLSGMSTLPGGIPGARSSASATATGSGMGAGMGAGGEPTAGWPGGRWSRAGTPAGDDGAGAGNTRALSSAPHDSLSIAAETAAAAAVAALSGVSTNGSLGGGAPAPPRSAACFSSDCGSAAAGGGATAYGSSNKALRPTSTMLRTSSCAVASCAAACGLTRDPAPAGGVPLGAARSNTHIGFVTSAPLSTVQAQALPARASGTASLSSSWSRSSCERASPVQAAQLQQQQLVSDGGFGGAGSASAVELLPSQGVADEEEADAEVARLMMGASGVAAATATITATATSPSTGGAAAPTALAPAPAEPLEGPWPAEVTSAWRDRSPMPDSLATAAAATAGAAARTATATATGRRSDTPLLSLSRAQWRPSGTASGDSRPATGTGLVPTLGGCAAPSPDPVAVSSRASVPLPLPSRAVSSPHMMVIASSTSARGAGGVVINFTHATAATITTSPSTNGISASAGSSIRPTSTTGLSVYGAHAAAAGGAGATPATTSVTSSRPASVTGFSTVGCSSFSGTGSLPSRPTSVLGMSYSGAAGSRPVSRLGAHTGVTASGAEARAAPPRSRTSLAMRPHDKEDLAQSSWRAATASQMQLRLSKQLTSTGAALGAGAGLSRGGDVGSTADARARAWG